MAKIKATGLLIEASHASGEGTGTAVARTLAERFGGDIRAADWRHFGTCFSPLRGRKPVSNWQLPQAHSQANRRGCRDS